MECTKALRTGSGGDGQQVDPDGSTIAPNGGATAPPKPIIDEESVDMVACANKSLNDVCSYTLGSIMVTGTCQGNNNGLTCNTAAPKVDETENILESSCDGLVR